MSIVVFVTAVLCVDNRLPSDIWIPAECFKTGPLTITAVGAVYWSVSTGLQQEGN